MARIATVGRGGYCYHLNGALGALLDALGYQVTRHVGGVHGPDSPTGDEMANHLVLTVHGLPTDAHPTSDWYVDAGLGDALHEPLPLKAGTYRQGPFELVLEQTPGGVGDWHLTHDPTGSFAGMSWRTTPTGIDAFAQRHQWLSTSPDSRFVQVLTVQRRDTTGADILRGLTLKRIGKHATDTTLTARAELTAVLGDLFGIDLTTTTPEPGTASGPGCRPPTTPGRPPADRDPLQAEPKPHGPRPPPGEIVVMTRCIFCQIVFCQIVAGEAPAYVVAEDDHTRAFLDRGQATEGHTLVVPRQHAGDIWDIAPEDAAAVMVMAKRVAHLLEHRLAPDGLNLTQSNRPAGWQDVFHFHLHVIPRWSDDGLVPPWRPTHPSDGQLEATLARLR